VLRDGDVVGTDDAGRTALLLMLDPWTLDRLLAFDEDAADLEDADGEPGPSTVVDVVPPNWVALLLVTAPLVKSHADQGPVIAALPCRPH
jgi:hypothetical protein